MRKAGQLRCARAQLLLFSLFKPHEHAAAATCVQDVFFPSTLLEVWGRVGAALHAASRGLVSAVPNRVVDHAVLLLEIARPNWAGTLFFITKNKCAQKTAGLADRRDGDLPQLSKCLKFDSWDNRAYTRLYKTSAE